MRFRSTTRADRGWWITAAEIWVADDNPHDFPSTYIYPRIHRFAVLLPRMLGYRCGGGAREAEQNRWARVQQDSHQTHALPHSSYF